MQEILDLISNTIECVVKSCFVSEVKLMGRGSLRLKIAFIRLASGQDFGYLLEQRLMHQGPSHGRGSQLWAGGSGFYSKAS